MPCYAIDRTYSEFWEESWIHFNWKLSFFGSGFYCSLQIMDNGYALLPYLQFTAGGFAAFVDRYCVHIKKNSTLIDLNV